MVLRPTSISFFQAITWPCAVGLWLAITVVATAAEPKDIPGATLEQNAFFTEKVKPLLEQHCVRCHGGAKPKGGLRLTSREHVLAGGDSGPAVSLESPAESLLIQAINYDGYEMPPSGKLPKEQIEILTKWVYSGLAFPTPLAAKSSDTAAAHAGPPPVNDETKKFWSFVPVKLPDVPTVQNKSWVNNPIDAFVLARLEEAGLTPNEPADKAALIRRAYYDLTGLPPEPQEVKAFLADNSPQAFERIIDRLLESPHYGERWGRHWLDLVRYAESNSYERDGAKPFVWRYRDYVIRSLNDDKPYNEFLREQIAGDELDPVTPDGIVATGFYRLGIWDDEPVDPEQAFYDDVDDIVQTTGTVFLGLTIGCARCHDHKLDPIPQRDYYSFLAYFRNIRRYGVRSHESVMEASVRTIAQDEDKTQHQELVRAYEADVRRVKTRLDEIENKVKPDLVGVENDEFKTEAARVEIVRKRVPRLFTDEQVQIYEALLKHREQLRANKPPALAQALCVTEVGREVPATHILIRGNPHVKGDIVEPAAPSVLTAPPASVVEPKEGLQSSGRRLALANWLADPANPLTARVMVNRVWQYHFGRGIVPTSSDFGFQGTRPTHPELLDWLAADFVDGGWRLKRLHKLIMLSSAYQMSSQGNNIALAKDPENLLFWRFNMRRLSAEEIRDSILAANGSLNRTKMFGPSVYVRIPAEVLAGQSRPGDGWGKSSAEDENRRSIYIHVKRSLLTPILTAYDAADTDSSCPVRFATTQPTQALGMLNSDFLQEQARAFANYVRQAGSDELKEQVGLALTRTLQRDPKLSEIERGVQLIESLRQKHGVSTAEALPIFCLTALNLNEFLYLD
jgi:mono/diheme cytochrome c family protein